MKKKRKKKNKTFKCLVVSFLMFFICENMNSQIQQNYEVNCEVIIFKKDSINLKLLMFPALNEDIFLGDNCIIYFEIHLEKNSIYLKRIRMRKCFDKVLLDRIKKETKFFILEAEFPEKDKGLDLVLPWFYK